jgi:N-acetylmuramoyl-L-alanine amidase
MRIAVRKGHTILRNGLCTSASGIVNEYTEVRRIGDHVICMLREQGHEVLDVTPPDRFCADQNAELVYGVKQANNWKADLFLSLHLNKTAGGYGVEVYHHKGSSKGYQLADRICKEIASLGFRNRGPKVKGLYEINHTNMTAVLVENFFCDSQKDVDLYANDPARIARKIVKAVTGVEPGVIHATAPVQSQPTPQPPKPQGDGKAIVPYPGYVIKRGAKGKDVERIQRAVGFPESQVDGDYGKITEARVKEYQARHGLVADGKVGILTWNMMF